jgi:hypothetical protein
VGWEAGYQAAYFGGQKLIGVFDTLPKPTERAALMADLVKASPDAVVVWGRPPDKTYRDLAQQIASQRAWRATQRIFDPKLGEVGMVFLSAP